MRVCLHRGHGFVSSLIKWQTRSQFSHVSLQFSDGKVFEAREFIGVHSLPQLEPRKGEQIDIYRVDIEARQEMAMRRFCESQMGKPYDYISIVRFLTREPVKDWQKDDWFCSEFAFYSFHLVGIKLLQNIQPWAVSPAQFSLSPLLHFERKIRG